MGVDVPSLARDTEGPSEKRRKAVERAHRLARGRIAKLLPDEELAQFGKAVLYELASDVTEVQRGEDAEPYVDARTRVAASVALIDAARRDLALAGPGKARTATEMLLAVRRALPELERRAALEGGTAPALPPDDDGPEW